MGGKGTLELRRVYARFALYAGLDEEALEPWKHLCETAEGSIVRRLRRGIDPRRHMERLCAAAALCAWVEYLTLSGGGTADRELRVGDIAVKGEAGAGLGEAAAARDRALAGAADLLLPERAAFLLAVREQTP